MQWEYLVLHVVYASVPTDNKLVVDRDTAKVSIQGLGSAMTTLGAEEWEAYSVIGEGNGAIKHIFFKRPFAEHPDDELASPILN
jgi:hypothetical protein